MATPQWQPGKLYPPGSLVVPRSGAPSVGIDALVNPSFETGDATGWTLGGGCTIVGYGYTGAYSVKFSGTGGNTYCMNDTVADAYPNMRVRATGYYAQGSAGTDKNVGFVVLRWFDASMTLIRQELGNKIRSSKPNWQASTIYSSAPSNARYVQLGCLVDRNSSKDSFFDYFSWENVGVVTAGLVYRAVQPQTGYSDTVEPNWPPVQGQTVIDKEVIWEAVVASRITWKAQPILKSGPTEPTWKTQLGSTTADNTINWILDDRRIDDPNCPNSEIVVLDQNKIYAGDGDIIPFCALNNPLDWTTANNAGYLPFGNGRYGSNPVSALGLYRARLMAFNSEGMQDWQIDPDPALNQRLNSLPIGCTYHHSFSPVSNDAMLLTAVGVRTLGLAASTSNLSVGDAGTPVDPLIKSCMYRPGKTGLRPKGLYIPSAGQYWLMFVGDEARPPGNGPAGSYLGIPMVPWNDQTLVYVYAVSEVGKIGAWQRYYFPFPIQAAVIAESSLGETVLAVRSGSRIIHIHERFLNDLMEVADGFPDGTGGLSVFSRIQWAWLEMGGMIGQDKSVEGVDIVGEHSENFMPSISMGWNQNNPNAFTSPYQLPYDTVPGEPVAFELTAPSIAVRLEYNGGAWKFTALNVYLQDARLAR